jgi:hypothetical protein
MKEKMPTGPEKKAKKSPAALAKEWEKKLAKEGLTAEPGEDKAAAILRNAHEQEFGRDVPEVEIRQKIQDYWVNRGENIGFGDHRLAAAAIAEELGIATDDVPEDLMKDVEQEVSKLEFRAREIISSKADTALRYKHDKLVDYLTGQLEKEFSDFSPMALQGIISRAIGE